MSQYQEHKIKSLKIIEDISEYTDNISITLANKQSEQAVLSKSMVLDPG